MEVAAEPPIDAGSDGDAAAQQATTKALSKFLSYDELKAHLAVNYAGLEASLLPNTRSTSTTAAPRMHQFARGEGDRRQPAGE